MTEQNNQNDICAKIGCNKTGHLSRRLGSSMYSFRVIICEEHEKELMKTV